MKKYICTSIAFVAVVTIGVLVVPKLLNKYTKKIYKNSHRDISFDDLEPVIVRKEYSNGN